MATELAAPCFEKSLLEKTHDPARDPSLNADPKGGCCDDGDAAHPDKVVIPDPAPSWLNTVFYQGLALCLGELPVMPRTVLIVGGCRQRVLARQLALKYVFSKLTVLDPLAAEAERAYAEIRCRFRFSQGALESLPFEEGAFDLVIAHNIGEFIESPRQAFAELGRVGSSYCLWTQPHPLADGWAGRLVPGFGAQLAENRLTPRRQDALPAAPSGFQPVRRLTAFPWELTLAKRPG